VQALEASLRRLRTDHVDILWLHAWDYLTPPEEVMRALDDQVRLGKVLYLGVSDTPAWVVAQMHTLAATRGWSTFSGLQVEYSLVQREVERELVPMARGLGLSVLAWGPLGAGVLSGKYAGPAQPGERRLANVDPGRLAIAKAVADAAAVPAASPHTAARRCQGERHAGAGSAPTATWINVCQAGTAARLARARAAPAGLRCTISR
jgi:aryl-alcohol dehydrogenase-like predicted oxidoreductase